MSWGSPLSPRWAFISKDFKLTNTQTIIIWFDPPSYVVRATLTQDACLENLNLNSIKVEPKSNDRVSKGSTKNQKYLFQNKKTNLNKSYPHT
jgi:hypothetical protein